MALFRLFFVAAAARAVSGLQQKGAEKQTSDGSSSSDSSFYLEVTESLTKPKAAAREMVKNAQKLDYTLQDMQLQTSEEMESRRAALEEEVATKQEENQRLAEQNEELNYTLAVLRQMNADLRKQSEDLLLSNEAGRQDLQNVIANITLAQEFALITLNSSNVSVNDTSPYKILFDLVAKEEAAKEALAHEQQMKTIGRKSKRFKRLVKNGRNPFSLMQTAMKARAKAKLKFHIAGTDEAEDMLKRLNESMAKLAEQQNETADAMEEEFERELNATVKERTELLAAQTQLNATIEAENQTHALLETALAHVQGTAQRLESRRASLMTFARKLTDAPNPLSESAKGSTAGAVKKIFSGALHLKQERSKVPKAKGVKKTVEKAKHKHAVNKKTNDKKSKVKGGHKQSPEKEQAVAPTQSLAEQHEKPVEVAKKEGSAPWKPSMTWLSSAIR